MQITKNVFEKFSYKTGVHVSTHFSVGVSEWFLIRSGVTDLRAHTWERTASAL